MVHDLSPDDDVQELLTEVAYLRRIARLNIIRGAIISENDEEVGDMLTKEAAVMLSVCSRVEGLFTE